MDRCKWFVLLITLITVKVFALETVNLVKDYDFENTVDDWLVEYGASNPDYSEAEAELQNTSIVYEGNYSAMSNTINRPQDVPPDTRDTAEFYQELLVTKELQDFDSIHFAYYDSCIADSIHHAFFSVDLRGPYGPEQELIIRYHFYYDDPFATPADLNFRKVLPFKVSLNEWREFLSCIYEDFIVEKGVPSTWQITKISLHNYGMEIGAPDPNSGWWGQKVFWDDIRLTGWADYNIALTRLTGTLGQPAAMVWNNGREDQTDVMIVATIEGGEPYADTVILTSLASDDSTEVTFAEFGPISPSDSHYLTIMTGGAVGMLDECDEDDMLYKEYLGIAESNLDEFALEVQSITNLLHVFYTLPPGQPGVISVFDPSGRLVERAEVKGPGFLTIGYLPSGMYFVRLETNQDSLSQKAVVLN